MLHALRDSSQRRVSIRGELAVVMIPAETLMAVEGEHRDRLMNANKAGMRLARIERDIRNLEETLREQASGSQDGYILQVADDLRRILA